MAGWRGAAAVMGLAAGVAGCASLMGSTRSSVRIDTHPTHANCELKGRDGFAARLTTPGRVTIPNSAAPVSVTCRAPGYRATSYTLDDTADGWLWGNSALVVVTGGAAVLGLLVDESRDAGKTYGAAVDYRLDPARPRAVRAIQRHGRALLLKAE